MFRIGRDFRGLFVYEDDRPITNAVGEIIIIPIFMLIAPPVLILLFFWSLGVPGVISAIVMSIVAFVAFWFSKRNTGLKQKVICAWYSTIICVLYVVSIVYSIYARNEWGFFTWVAMGLCGLTLIFVTMSINNFDLVSGIVWISIILTWLFSMAIVYGINHGQMVPGYIYITVAAPIGVEFFVALIQTLRLTFSPLK